MADILIFVEEGYEEFELWVPYYRFLEAGFTVEIVGKEKGRAYAGKHGIEVRTDAAFGDVDLAGVKVVLIPGGHAPDRLRLHEEALSLVRKADEKGIVIAAICHAGSVLVSAGIVSGRRLTSYRSIRDDLIAAGGEWVDEPVVIDRNLVTSRTPCRRGRVLNFAFLMSNYFPGRF
jgi:protease I